MDIRKGVADRHASTRTPSAAWRDRLRKSVAMFALSALALAGLSALAAAPASADEAPPVVVCSEPQVLDEATQECVDPVEETTEGAEESTDQPALVCDEGFVPNEAGDACVEAPAALVCDEGLVLNEAGDACVEPGLDDSLSALKVVQSEVVANANGPSKIQFCHRTASETNPYVYLDTSIQAFFNSGHISHTGPIFPAVGPDNKWGDIYPPNQYDEDGQNWTTEGQAIFNNDCAVGDNPPDTPGVDIEIGQCVLYGGTEVSVELTNLEPSNKYELWLDGQLMDSGNGGQSIGFSEVLDPGDYELTVKMFDASGKNLLLEFTVEFTVEACPDLGLDVTPDACSIGDNGGASMLFTGLIAGEEYSWYVSGNGGYFDEGTFEATGDTETVTLSGLPPDHYYAFVAWVPGGANLVDSQEPEVWAEDWFTVEPCEPEITVTVTECPTMGGKGSALVQLSNLVEGVEYDVWVTARGDESGPTFGTVHTVVGNADGKASVNFASLPAPGEYTAWVEGEFSWPHATTVLSIIENPGYETVTLKDHVDFALKACPPALPATGLDPLQALTMSMLLGGAGALVVAAGRLRRFLG